MFSQYRLSDEGGLASGIAGKIGLIGLREHAAIDLMDSLKQLDNPADSLVDPAGEVRSMEVTSFGDSLPVGRLGGDGGDVFDIYSDTQHITSSIDLNIQPLRLPIRRRLID